MSKSVQFLYGSNFQFWLVYYFSPKTSTSKCGHSDAILLFGFKLTLNEARLRWFFPLIKISLTDL